MKKPKALKVGDDIKIVNPIFVNRFGYPLNTKIIKNGFTSEQIRQMENFFDEFVMTDEKRTDYIQLGINRLKHALAYSIMKYKNHGGNERRLYTQTIPELIGGISKILKRKVVKTGTRVPPSGGYDYYGEYDYDPGYLKNEKTHVLYQIGTVDVDSKSYSLCNDTYNIAISDIYNILEISELPVYIEKINVEPIPKETVDI